MNTLLSHFSGSVAPENQQELLLIGEKVVALEQLIRQYSETLSWEKLSPMLIVPTSDFVSKIMQINKRGRTVVLWIDYKKSSHGYTISLENMQIGLLKPDSSEVGIDTIIEAFEAIVAKLLKDQENSDSDFEGES